MDIFKSSLTKNDFSPIPVFPISSNDKQMLKQKLMTHE